MPRPDLTEPTEPTDLADSTDSPGRAALADRNGPQREIADSDSDSDSAGLLGSVPPGSPAVTRPGRRLVLLLDPDEASRRGLGQALRHAGYAVRSTADLPEALRALQGPPVDLILAALPRAQEAAAFELAQLTKHTGHGATILALCPGLGSDGERAASLIAAGAYDVLPQPCRPSEALLALAKAAAREQQRGDPASARFLPQAQNSDRDGAGSPEIPGLIATSPRMVALLAMVRRLAKNPHPATSVLLTGESGTGKELLARALHRLSPRHAGPFVAVNCGALPESLLEGLLFGHVRGAFTDAVRDQPGLLVQASGGTLFLDEIGELPLGLQVKLLRVLQERTVVPLGGSVPVPFDVRLVAATLRNLEAEAAAGRFRADLYYRLSVVTLELPPLRERAVDILPLARAFLRAASERLRLPLAAFTPAAEQALLRYPWPGNVRELANTIERAAVLCERTLVDLADLPLSLIERRGAGPDARSSGSDPAELAGEAPAADALLPPAGELSIKQACRRVETVLIQRALVRTHGNRSAAARLLELSHPALLYKLREYGLDTQPKPGDAAPSPRPRRARRPAKPAP